MGKEASEQHSAYPCCPWCGAQPAPDSLREAVLTGVARCSDCGREFVLTEDQKIRLMDS